MDSWQHVAGEVLGSSATSLTWPSCAVALAVCAVVTYGLNVVERWKLRHLPGPSPSMFAGNLPEMRGRNTWDVYTAWTRKYGRVYRWFQGRQGMVTIADPDLVKEVLVTKFQSFPNREMPRIFKQLGRGPVQRFKANMVFAQDKDWSSVRSAVMPFFHSKELGSYCSDMNLSISRLSGILKQHASGDEPADMRKYFGALALEVVGTAAFGIDFNTQSKEAEDPLVSAVTTTIKPNPTLLKLGAVLQTFPFLCYVIGFIIRMLPVIGGEKFRKGQKARMMPAGTTYMLLRNAEKKLMGEPPEEWGPTVELPWGEGTFHTAQNKYKDTTPKEGSLPDLLIKGKHKVTGEKLTPVQMVAQTAVFLLAGYDTTANTLSYCLWLLSRHPEEQDKIIAEIDSVAKATEDLTSADLADFPYTRAAVDEALRMYPPAPSTGRVAKVDATIGKDSIRIPAGSNVMVNIIGMHYDPEFFPDPEVFRPSRFLKGSAEAEARHPYAYLPFGAGHRMCIGYKFALQEIMLTLISTLRKYTFAPDPARNQTVMKSSGMLTMGPAEGVWLKVSAR